MTTETARIDPRYTHAVVFIGPPFGPTDGGRIVSLHSSGHAAEHVFDRMAAAAGGLYENVVVVFDDPYWRDPDGRSARDHFAGAAG